MPAPGEAPPSRSRIGFRSSSSEPVEYAQLPKTSPARLLDSLEEKPLELCSLIEDGAESTSKSRETVLYLAYGSNLCRETFRGKRGIRPISQLNVVVPQLVMTFSLPGIPYSEPCFSNTRARHPSPRDDEHKTIGKEHYHKDAWYKGLVGVVYEVTRADYARIIATEGGGASYEDVLVNCYALSDDPTILVPTEPSGSFFKAHTLSAPATPEARGGRPLRPDLSYAQASPRYMKLLTDGADELTLPYEYQRYLHSIRAFYITTKKQRIGKSIFTSMWWPLIFFIFSTGHLFADKQGRYPPWLARLSTTVFVGMWSSYDHFFKKQFGDGERTMGTASNLDQPGEKQRLMLGEKESWFAEQLEDRVLPNMSISHEDHDSTEKSIEKDRLDR